MNMIKHCTLGIALMCCFLSVEAGSTTNLVTNGDFERGMEGWQRGMAGWQLNAGEIVPGPNGTGHCVRISSSNTNDHRAYLTQKIDPNLIKGALVRLEAKVKAQGVVRGIENYSQATITLGWNDGETYNKNFIGTFDWKKVSALWGVGTNCTNATLYLGLHSTTGTVWFDDVTLTVLKPKVKKTVAEGVAECIYEDDSVGLCVDGHDFVEAKPDLSTNAANAHRATADETSRGFVVFQPDNPGDIVPGRQPSSGEAINSFELSAAPDQKEPIFFAVHALSPLKQVQVQVTELTGPKGQIIQPDAFDIRRGRYVIQRCDYNGAEFHVTPKLLMKNSEISILPERPQLFWLTLHVPPEAPAGKYTGTVQIQADGKTMSLPLHLRVLPFHLAKGKPWMLFYYNSADAAEADFRDMKDHGLTSVILAQVQAPIRREGDKVVVDFTSSDAFVKVYRKAGFSDPLVYNPFHDRLATILLELFGLADPYPKKTRYGENFCVFKDGEYPESLQKVYRQVVRDIHEHAKQVAWPPMLFYPVDEPGPGEEHIMTAARLEYRLAKETVPTAPTFCTAYELPTMERLEPWVDVRAVPISDLATSAKKNQAYQSYLSRAGGKFWGIAWPAASDDFWLAREIGGFLPAKTGVPAMTAWTYYAPMPYADEYNDLRGGFKRCVFAYHDADRSLIPTTTWEGLRAGITDWRYIATLEEAISKAKGKRQERGITALREILAEVPWQDQAQTGWGNRRAAQLREKVVKAILDVSSGGDGKNWWHFWD